MNEKILKQLENIVGPENINTRSNVLQNGSRDCYWYSPVLKPQLDGKQADVIVRPQTIEQIQAIIRLAVRKNIPITPRGAGTGNYGQGVPLQGGILLNTKNMDNILELTSDYARLEAGTILNTIEQQARQQVGAELRFFPSTLMTATAAGFLAGGSGGVGSVTWGTLWDEGNVLGVTIVTVEEEPQVLQISDPAGLQGVIHNCGLTCFIADVTFALAPATDWHQYVAAFDGFEETLRFGESLAYDDNTAKRLITALEWPIPSYFKQLTAEGACPEGKAILMLHLANEPETVRQRVATAGGQVTWHKPEANQHRGDLQLTDFSWNHTTLWAMKADENFTYLQDLFDSEKVYEQLAQRKARYGDQILEHIEFMKFRGKMNPQGLSLLRYQSKEQLWEIIEYCESIGIWIANPHTHYLDEDVRWNGQPILDAKVRWDPHSLLNPGHLRALEEE